MNRWLDNGAIQNRGGADDSVSDDDVRCSFLSVTGAMSLRQWIDMASTLDVDAFVTGELHASARLVSNFGNTHTFMLPKVLNVGQLFEKLETRKASGDLREWGVSQASLEEVFVRIALESEHAVSS